MVFAHPELLVPSIVGLVVALYPLPWHLRSMNIGTLSMIFWMALLNVIHIVNSAVWSDNVEIKAVGWGDITAAAVVGYNYAIPLSHLVLAKQLESLTSLRPRSALYDFETRRKHRLFDLSVLTICPIAGILIHLSMMDRRFYLIEGFGPMPATYWDTWGVIAMAIVPILIAFACAVYTIMAIVNVHLRRQQLLALIHPDSSVNKEQFIRLLILAIAMLATCSLRAIFNLVSFENGPQPMGHRGEPSRNLTIIETLTSDQISTTGLLVLRLQWYTVVACSIIFFVCFATGTETKSFYAKLARKIVPCCMPAERQGRQSKLGSWDSGASRSQGTASQIPYTSRDVASGSKAKQDISLEEMLGTPVTPKPRHEKRAYDEEAADALYLEPIPK